MQTMPPPDTVAQQPAPESEPEAGQATVPPPAPAAGKKLARKVVKPAAAPADATPPAPEAAVCATPWQLARTFGPGLELRAGGGDRIRATIHLVRAADENGPYQRTTKQRQELRDRLAAQVKAQAEAMPAFRDFAAVWTQLLAHQTAAKLAKATAEELTGRRKRLTLSNEANLAEQLQAIDRELEAAAATLAQAEQSAAVLAPLVEERRAGAEKEAARAIDPAAAEIRNELKRQENAALAALMTANTAQLDELVVLDGLLRTFSSGDFGGKELARSVFGE